MALKTWCGDDSGWRTKLSDSTTVCIADDDVGAGGFDEKPWWICLAQTDAPPVRSNLPGKHLLLSQGEARALVAYLLDSGLLELDLKAQTVIVAEDDAVPLRRIGRARKKATPKKKTGRSS